MEPRGNRMASPGRGGHGRLDATGPPGFLVRRGVWSAIRLAGIAGCDIWLKHDDAKGTIIISTAEQPRPPTFPSGRSRYLTRSKLWRAGGKSLPSILASPSVSFWIFRKWKSPQASDLRQERILTFAEATSITHLRRMGLPMANHPDAGIPIARSAVPRRRAEASVQATDIWGDTVIYHFFGWSLVL